MVVSVVWLQYAATPPPPHTPIQDPIKHAATPPNQPQRCILTGYFNNYKFSKAQIIRSLMMVIELKHVGAVLM